MLTTGPREVRQDRMSPKRFDAPPDGLYDAGLVGKCQSEPRKGHTMKTRMLLLTLLAGGVVSGLGCTTTVIDSGGETSATYRFGRLTATVEADIASAYQATEQAMQELGLNVVQKLQDQLEAQVIARDAQDKRIGVELLSITNAKTKVVIQAGSLVKAGRIDDTILANLKKG